MDSTKQNEAQTSNQASDQTSDQVNDQDKTKAITNSDISKEVRFMLFDNFSNYEMSKIISFVKSLIPKEKHSRLVFAKKTEQSQNMTLNELIEDVKEDHFYLLANPPQKTASLQNATPPQKTDSSKNASSQQSANSPQSKSSPKNASSPKKQ